MWSVKESVYCHFFRYAQWVVYGQILLQQKLTDDWKSAQKRNIHGMRFVVVSGTGESNTSRSMFVNEVSKSTVRASPHYIIALASDEYRQLAVITG